MKMKHPELGYAKKYYAEHRLEILAKQKAYVQRTRERRVAYMKAYTERNSAKLKAIAKERRSAMTPEQKEKLRVARNRWRKNNPNYGKEWAVRNAKKMRAYRMKWQLRHKAFRNEQNHEYFATRRQCTSDGSAKAFYLFVRAKKRIRCYYCGRWVTGKEAHIDHVISVNNRGNHASENLAASCPECNYRKSAKLPSEVTFIKQGLLNL